MSELHYCDNGCTRTTEDGKQPIAANNPSRICDHCEDRLHTWLTKIPETYALLPTFIEHGALEKNPESKATKGAVAQAPMRLDIIDLLDVRRGRRWQGLTPTEDRRGVAGYLKVHLDRLIEERPLTATKPITTIAAACDLLDRHRLWIAEQDWVGYLYEDTKLINRQLSDAIGDYRRPAVGKCPIETDEGTCDGNLYPATYGGVHCTRCGSTWEAERLRQLGLILITEETA